MIVFVRTHARRYVALAFNYVTERGVLLGAMVVAAASGASDEALGRTELLLTAAALAAAIGPLGTQHALMYQAFRGSNRAWRLSLLTGAIGGILMGALAAATLGFTYALVGGVLGLGITIHRIASYRMRAAASTSALTRSSTVFVVTFALGAGLAYRTDDTASMVLVALFLAAVAASLPAAIGFQATDDTNPPQFGQMIRYGLPLSFAALSDWVVTAGDRYVIQAFLGLDQVGPYGVIYRTAMLLSGGVSTLVLWWQAEAMRSGYEWARAQLRYYVGLALGITALLGAALLVPMSVILARITDIPRGDVATIIGLLFVSVAGFVVLMGLMHLFAAAGWVKLVGWLSLGNAITNLAANLVLVPVAGIKGAAVATALSQCGTAAAGFMAYRLKNRLDSA